MKKCAPMLTKINIDWETIGWDNYEELVKHVNKWYRRMCLKYHPDKLQTIGPQSSEQMSKVSEFKFILMPNELIIK